MKMDPLHLTLEVLYDAHAAHLFAFAKGITRDDDEAREVLQDVFVKLARRPEALQGVLRPRSYLLRVTHRVAWDRVRKRETRRRWERDHAQNVDPPSSPPEPGADYAATDQLAVALGKDPELDTEQVLALLGALPPDQRIAVQLHIWEGLTFAEMAEVLDVPLNTAASRYRYALDKIRSGLRPLGQEQAESPQPNE